MNIIKEMKEFQVKYGELMQTFQEALCKEKGIMYKEDIPEEGVVRDFIYRAVLAGLIEIKEKPIEVLAGDSLFNEYMVYRDRAKNGKVWMGKEVPSSDVDETELSKLESNCDVDCQLVVLDTILGELREISDIDDEIKEMEIEHRKLLEAFYTMCPRAIELLDKITKAERERDSKMREHRRRSLNSYEV